MSLVFFVTSKCQKIRTIDENMKIVNFEGENLNIFGKT